MNNNKDKIRNRKFAIEVVYTVTQKLKKQGIEATDENIKKAVAELMAKIRQRNMQNLKTRFSKSENMN